MAKDEYIKLAETNMIGTKEYFDIIKLALYHTTGVVANTSTEVMKAETTPEVWECAVRILKAMYSNDQHWVE